MIENVSRRHPIKIGMLPVLTLVVALCLFMLAVLVLSTTNAASAIAERQALATQEAYAVESAAQRFVGEVDAALAQASSSGVTGAAAGARALSGSLGDIASSVANASESMTVTARVQDSQVDATFESASGRRLDIALEVTDDLGYRIDSWKLTTVQADEGPGETLWSGQHSSTGADDISGGNE